jgi:hypothetical protein
LYECASKPFFTPLQRPTWKGPLTASQNDQAEYDEGGKKGPRLSPLVAST